MQLAHVGEPEAPIYLNALDTELDGGGRVALPWRLAFAASPDLHPLRHALLGINAVLASRFAAEDDELAATGGAAMLDRLLTPLNRLGSERFLREARQKVWHNTLELHNVRVAGSQEYAVRLAELETGVAAYDRESTFTPPAVAPTRARGLGRAMLFAVGGPTEGLRDICRQRSRHALFGAPDNGPTVMTPTILVALLAVAVVVVAGIAIFRSVAARNARAALGAKEARHVDQACVSGGHKYASHETGWRCVVCGNHVPRQEGELYGPAEEGRIDRRREPR